MYFNFKNIPEESTFAVFDYANKETVESIVLKVPIGDSRFEINIPEEWADPHYSLRTLIYFVPNCYEPININKGEMTFSGSDYYLDATREETREEANKRSVKTLIISITKAQTLNGRQKFYTSLMALNSHFEYLVHGMLVLSGNINKKRFEKLQKHKNRIVAAFDETNIDFFAEEIELCPGKKVEPGEIPHDTKQQILTIMDRVRKTRNDIAHSWGYKDYTEEQLVSFFNDLKLPLPHYVSDEDMYEKSANQLIVLWAQCAALENRMSLIAERVAIAEERKERGY